MEFNFKEIKEKENAKEICLQYLEDISSDFKEAHSEYKRLEKILETYKSNVKNIFNFLEIDNFTSGKIKIYKTKTDKSYLEPNSTISFLKDKGLNEFVKTKEYFDDAELIYAIQNNMIDGSELANFKIENIVEGIRIK